MKITQSNARRITAFPLIALAISGALILGGCATDRPLGAQSIEQRVESARTESDHRDVAAMYEQQAAIDKELAEKHRKLAQTYAQSWSPLPPWGRAGTRMVRHCEDLVTFYEQSAKANLELAAEHRGIPVAGTK